MRPKCRSEDHQPAAGRERCRCWLRGRLKPESAKQPGGQGQESNKEPHQGGGGQRWLLKLRGQRNQNKVPLDLALQGTSLTFLRAALVGRGDQQRREGGWEGRKQTGSAETL